MRSATNEAIMKFRSIVVLALLMTEITAARTGFGGDTPAPAGTAGDQVLTLAEAVSSARAHQPALELARGALVTSFGQADQARAALLPQVNGSASYNRATNNYVTQPGGTVPAGKPATTTSFATIPLWKASLSASQLIYDFGETINRWKAAQVAAEALGESVHITETQIAYNARVAFFTARAAKDLVGVARDALANQEKHLAQVKRFVEAGTHPAIDLTQTRADRATAQLQLITAENTYSVAKASLNQAMGVERSIDYDLSDEEYPAVEGEDGSVEKLVDEAKQLRPEMANLRLNARSQELSLRSAHDMIWPQLSLSGSVYDSGQSLDRTTWNFSGLLVMSVPIYQGGAIRAQIRQAEGQLRQAKAQLETESQQVRFDVEQARLGIRAAKGAIAAAEDALANTRDRLRLAEGRYAAGFGSIIELGDAQVALTTSAAQKVQAQYQLYTARAQLIKALGRNE
jgi:outer membrane protein